MQNLVSQAGIRKVRFVGGSFPLTSLPNRYEPSLPRSDFNQQASPSGKVEWELPQNQIRLSHVKHAPTSVGYVKGR